MTEYVLVLSKENIALASAEALNLISPTKQSLRDNILICEGGSPLYHRLAYTKEVYRSIFSCDSSELLDKIKNFDFDSLLNEEYSVRIIDNKRYDLKEIAKAIHSVVKSPKVNLKNPKIEIVFIFIEDTVYCCEKISIGPKNFNDRRAHNRPELHPSSMHPKLARACVNLLGSKTEEIVDPFCGSGGLLIEAGIMGLRPIGYDIDEIMLRMAKINLEHYKIYNYTLEKRDATKLSDKIKYVLCDPPYGKNTKQKDTERLYSDFISNLSKILTKRAVIVYPDKIELKEYLSRIDCFKIKGEFSIRVHKSLTRNIVIIEKI